MVSCDEPDSLVLTKAAKLRQQPEQRGLGVLTDPWEPQAVEDSDEPQHCAHYEVGRADLLALCVGQTAQPPRLGSRPQPPCPEETSAESPTRRRKTAPKTATTANVRSDGAKVVAGGDVPPLTMLTLPLACCHA